MHSIAHMVGQGYHFGAPSQEAEEIDVQVAESRKCPRCGALMRYEGYHKNSGGYVEYIALAICSRCGYEVAF
jgi:C4-type Zn-finger protein